MELGGAFRDPAFQLLSGMDLIGNVSDDGEHERADPPLDGSGADLADDPPPIGTVDCRPRRDLFALQQALPVTLVLFPVLRIRLAQEAPADHLFAAGSEDREQALVDRNVHALIVEKRESIARVFLQVLEDRKSTRLN